MPERSRRSMGWILAGWLGFAGCTIEEPPCPRVEIPESTAASSNYCQCSVSALKDQAYRMTQIEIDEPESLAGLLNTMWKQDIRNNVINVLFEVSDLKAGSAAAFDFLEIKGGPGWRSPKDPLVFPPAIGQVSEDAVGKYYLLGGFHNTFRLEPYHGNQCVFKSVADSSLFFHTGPLDNPAVCATELTPQNNIPMKNLKVRFGFNPDCTVIENGYLEACLTQPDADKICMCLITGTCTIKPISSSNYCAAQCGGGWTSFGQALSAFKLLPTCVTSEGEIGYRIQGVFKAVRLDGKYSPVEVPTFRARGAGRPGG